MNDEQDKGLPSATFRQIFTLQDYQAIIDELKTKLRRVSAMLEQSTNLMDELLYDQFVVLGDEYTKKIIYQIAANQAATPQDIGEK